MRGSSFRRWCQEKWFEHKDELAFYGQPLSYNSAHYFSKYKFWLKREYRHQANESK